MCEGLVPVAEWLALRTELLVCGISAAAFYPPFLALFPRGDGGQGS